MVWWLQLQVRAVAGLLVRFRAAAQTPVTIYILLAVARCHWKLRVVSLRVNNLISAKYKILCDILIIGMCPVIQS